MKHPGPALTILILAACLTAAAAVPGAGLPQQAPVARFDAPLLITSAGMGPEVQLAAVLAKRAGIDHALSKEAAAGDLAGFKTLAVVVGASLKGLGAAGLDTAKEKERVEGVLAEAAKRNVPVILLHLGGEARRGELTDSMVEAALPSASLVIVLKSGNKDGLFTRLAEAAAVPLVEVEKTVDAADVLKAAFKPKT
jgi:hypothetical protein